MFLVRPIPRWPHTVRDIAVGRRGRLRQVLLWGVVAMVVARLCAPYVLTWIANRQLARGDDVRGAISGISLGLFRCDYAVHGLALEVRRQDGRWLPLLSAARIDCDLRWWPALRGELAGRVDVQQPTLHVYAAEVTPEAVVEALPEAARAQDIDEAPPRPPWQDAIRTVVRVHLTTCHLSDGEIHYHDERRNAHAAVTAIEATVSDLTIPELALTHRSPFRLTARTPGTGRLHLDGEVDVLATSPTFLARARLEEVVLTQLNPFTERVADLRFADGTFSGYAELVADGRRLGGYLKVLFHHLAIGGIGDADEGDRLGLFWSLVVATALEILENEAEHQHAARIPLAGPLAEPGTDVWTALGTALGNAFIRALAPGFEGARE